MRFILPAMCHVCSVGPSPYCAAFCSLLPLAPPSKSWLSELWPISCSQVFYPSESELFSLLPNYTLFLWFYTCELPLGLHYKFLEGSLSVSWETQLVQMWFYPLTISSANDLLQPPIIPHQNCHNSPGTGLLLILPILQWSIDSVLWKMQI